MSPTEKKNPSQNECPNPEVAHPPKAVFPHDGVYASKKPWMAYVFGGHPWNFSGIGHPGQAHPRGWGCEHSQHDAGRAAALSDGLKAAMFAALVIFALQVLLAFVNGELSWVIQRPGGGWLISIQGGRALLFPKAFDIVLWDLLLFGAGMLVLHRPRWLTPSLEALAAFTFCLLLWRIVLVNLGMIAFPSWVAAEMTRMPGVAETVFFLAILVVGKESIYRRLVRLDKELDSPLLAFFSWHHRKDAVFNVLYGLTVIGGLAGLSSERLFVLFAFVKVLLLGSAALDISGRCLQALIPVGADADSKSEELP